MEALIRTSGICWLAIGPLSCMGELITFVALHRHHANFLSSDVLLIFLMTSYFLTSLFVLFIPAVMYFAEVTWSVMLCDLYRVISIVLRTAQLSGLTALCINWAVSVRIFTEKRSKRALRSSKWVVLILTTLSLIVGVIPYSGVNFLPPDVPTTNSGCRFLAYSFGEGYALYFIVVTSFVLLVVLVVMCDASCVVSSMERVARQRFKTGRLNVPSPTNTIHDDANTITRMRDQRTITLYDIHACMRQSADVRKVILVVTGLSLLLSHLPYMVIQALQLFSTTDTQLLELVTLWLVAGDVIVTPSTVWLSARRYRHFWASPPHEGTEIRLKGFVMRGEQNGLVRSSISQRAVAPETHLRTRSYLSDECGSYDMRIPHEIGSNYELNGRVTATVVECHSVGRESSDAAFVKTANRRSFPVGGTNKLGDIEIARPRHFSASNERCERDPKNRHSQILEANKLSLSNPIKDFESLVACQTTANSSDDLDVKLDNAIEIDNARNNDKLDSLNKSVSAAPGKTTDISPSRKIWMERMRKKHLPAIFVNDAFERDKRKSQCESQSNTHKKSGSNTSLYYFCGEYHPDNLIGSLTGSLNKTEGESIKMATSFTGSLTSPEVVILEDEVMSQSLTDNLTFTCSGDTASDVEYRSIDIDEALMRDGCDPFSSDRTNSDVSIDRYLSNMTSFSDGNKVLSAEGARTKLPTVTENIDSPAVEVTNPWWTNSRNPFSNDMIESKSEMILSVKNFTDSGSNRILFDADVDRGFEEALEMAHIATPVDGVGSVSEVAMPTGDMTSYNPFVYGTYSVTSSECSFATHAVVPRFQHSSNSNSMAHTQSERISFPGEIENGRPESYTDSSGFVENLDETSDTIFSTPQDTNTLDKRYFAADFGNRDNIGDSHRVSSVESDISLSENSSKTPSPYPKSLQQTKTTRQPVFL